MKLTNLPYYILAEKIWNISSCLDKYFFSSYLLADENMDDVAEQKQ